jgi:hypothetical protein
MNGQPNDSAFRNSLARLERRVDITLDQCRRFEQMVATLETWAAKWSTATLERWLYLDHLPLDEREKALVALAIQATPKAGAVLDTYNPMGSSDDHQIFCQVARIEWEQRQQARPQRRAAA